MGMSTHVYGIKPPDDSWRRMKAVYEACHSAGVSVPSEVDDFFDGESPDDEGVVLSLNYPTHDAVSVYEDQYRSGYEIDVTKLPKDIKIIRVVNCW